MWIAIPGKTNTPTSKPLQRTAPPRAKPLCLRCPCLFLFFTLTPGFLLFRWIGILRSARVQRRPPTAISSSALAGFGGRAPCSGRMVRTTASSSLSQPRKMSMSFKHNPHAQASPRSRPRLIGSHCRASSGHGRPSSCRRSLKCEGSLPAHGTRPLWSAGGPISFTMADGAPQQTTTSRHVCSWR